MTRGRRRDDTGTRRQEARQDVGRSADRRAAIVIVGLAVIGGVVAAYLGEPKPWQNSAPSVPHTVQSQGSP